MRYLRAAVALDTSAEKDCLIGSNMFLLAILGSFLPALVASQSLVLVGGGLTDGNAPVWNRIVELAVEPRRQFYIVPLK